jgi:hypothetical protein
MKGEPRSSPLFESGTFLQEIINKVQEPIMEMTSLPHLKQFHFLIYSCSIHILQ